MNRCPRCKIEVKDPSVMCPLCRSVLEKDTSGESETQKMYPEPGPALKRLRFATRITIFSAVVAELIAILVNYLTFSGTRWSMIVGAGLIYGCFSLIYSVRRNKSHQRKIVVQLAIGLFVILFIDFSLGFQGWSMNYGFPGAIGFVDIGMLVLMIVNFKDYQSYLYPMIWVVIISVICLLLDLLVMKVFPFWNIIAVVATGLLLAGMIVFGDKKAEGELLRRFHI